MNKIVLTLFSVICLCMTTLNSFAVELFPYKTQTPQGLGGTVKVQGCEDYIILPSSDDTPFLKELFAPSSLAVAAASILAVDPYIVPIDGINYVLVKDKSTNDWSEKDLLGIDDPKDNMFLALRSLESDGDASKLTSAELKKAKIRFVKLADNGTLLVNERKQDFQLDKIKFIDLKNIRKTANSKSTGVFGHFNVYLKTKDNSKKLAVGFVTFDTHSNLKILFN